MDWQPYDPIWLVSLAKEQLPELAWLPEALGRCTRCHIESVAYIYFVNPERPNEPGSEWQFEYNEFLSSQMEGTIVLDILAGQRVGGVEFVSKIRQTQRR